MKTNNITVKNFFSQNGINLQLKLIAGHKGLNRKIVEPTVNRPGLALAGFTKYFAFKRVQAMGSAENSFLKTLPEGLRMERYEKLFSYRIPCIVICRHLHPDKLLIQSANKHNIPIFSCPSITMRFINLATIALESMFAPKATEIGSMVDIHGVGVIIKGESGIGKSESVLALIERGYSLVADDLTKLTLIDGHVIMGTSADITRNHMEVRGIGIIDIAAMFGVKSIREKKRVDLIITLKPWEKVKDIERLGMSQQYTKILGIDVPHVIIPVRPGRDLARLVEVAALNAKLNLSGYNAAQNLNRKLIDFMSQKSD
ncbi:MAG: HPr(Ser) kinase/phosphatase [Verrucomicrobia bacterium]|nr:HPr(Ser) kinase/phosphatase [Verrucomicrobiota bacterium]MCF7708761.1 HPr(Ser) kinase/phosphatase [Verrucomicrobiota bacterium]